MGRTVYCSKATTFFRCLFMLPRNNILLFFFVFYSKRSIAEITTWRRNNTSTYHSRRCDNIIILTLTVFAFSLSFFLCPLLLCARRRTSNSNSNLVRNRCGIDSFIFHRSFFLTKLTGFKSTFTERCDGTRINIQGVRLRVVLFILFL